MVNTMISIPGYVHLYRSLLRFYDMPENEVREMLYLLNTTGCLSRGGIGNTAGNNRHCQPSIITRTAV